MLRINSIKDGDWKSVRSAFQQLQSNVLGTESTPTFAGLTLSNMIQGSIIFAGSGGVLSQDNSNLFWDDTNNRLGIGTNSPSASIHTSGAIQLDSATWQIVDKFSVEANRNVYIGDNVFAEGDGTDNIGIGRQTGYYNNYGIFPQGVRNVYIGTDSGKGSGAGVSGANVGVGYATLMDITDGQYDTAIGYQAGTNVTTGSHTTLVGNKAGFSQTTASNNTILGTEAAYYNQTGTGLTIVGYRAGGYGAGAVNSNSYNSILGDSAGYNLTTGGYNLLGGADAGKALTTGANNCFLGYQSGYKQTTASGDVMIGYQAGYNDNGDTTLGSNLFMGYQAFYNDNGTFNVGIGYQAGYYNDSSGASDAGDKNLYIGYQSGYGDSGPGTLNSGKYNVGLGYKTLQSNTTGYHNWASGYAALINNLSGIQNWAAGSYALYNNTTGSYNLALGVNTLYTASTIHYNLGIGNTAGKDLAAGTYNVYIGSAAAEEAGTAYYNTIIGYEAAKGVNATTTLHSNVAIGYRTLYDAQASCNYNTVVGTSAGENVTTGDTNTFLGYKSGYNQTTNSNLLIIDNQDRGSVANEAIQSLIYGTFNATPASQQVTINGNLNVRHHLAGIPDAITATSEGTAASLDTINTEVTTNGDEDLDNVTLANGTSGQIKNIYCVAVGHANDTWKITPTTMLGGTTITFSGAGEGCTLVYADNEGWVVLGNNGGTIA